MKRLKKKVQKSAQFNLESWRADQPEVKFWKKGREAGEMHQRGATLSLKEPLRPKMSSKVEMLDVFSRRKRGERRSRSRRKSGSLGPALSWSPVVGLRNLGESDGPIDY